MQKSFGGFSCKFVMMMMLMVVDGAWCMMDDGQEQWIIIL
jgi:hypothetical protein